MREQHALEQLRAARTEVAGVVATAVEWGATYDALACASLRARTGRSPSIDERHTEAARLRQLLRRANERHTIRTAPGIASPENELRLPEEETNMATPSGKVIERTTTTVKERIVDDDVERDDHDEDLDETDEPDNKPSRRRSR